MFGPGSTAVILAPGEMWFLVGCVCQLGLHDMRYFVGRARLRRGGFRIILAGFTSTQIYRPSPARELGKESGACPVQSDVE